MKKVNKQSRCTNLSQRQELQKLYTGCPLSMQNVRNMRRRQIATTSLNDTPSPQLTQNSNEHSFEVVTYHLLHRPVYQACEMINEHLLLQCCHSDYFKTNVIRVWTVTIASWDGAGSPIFLSVWRPGCCFLLGSSTWLWIGFAALLPRRLRSVSCFEYRCASYAATRECHYDIKWCHCHSKPANCLKIGSCSHCNAFLASGYFICWAFRPNRLITRKQLLYWFQRE